jgi:hypothetical protein
MLESYGKPGDLFNKVIFDQFTRIRNADRFWFDNEDWNLHAGGDCHVIVNSTEIEPGLSTAIHVLSCLRSTLYFFTYIYTVDRKGENWEVSAWSNTKSIQVELSQVSYTKKRPLVLLRMCNVNDLALELKIDGARRKIVKKLEDFLILHKKEMTITEQNRELMLAKARKREWRQKRLDHFFREAYASACDLVFVFGRP